MPALPGCLAAAPHPFPVRANLLSMVTCLLLASATAQAADEAPPPTELPDVVVSSQHVSVERRVDRTIYDVTGDLQSATGNLGDILDAIPSLDVDGDGNLSLRGDTNVLILIDGKPSALFSGSSAGENLLSIPARDIVRVEVMTDPPPQYKADGVAGVINIITRHTIAHGLAGSGHLNYGSEGRYGTGGSLSYGQGPLNATLSAQVRHYVRTIEQTSVVTTPATAGTPATQNSSTLDERMSRIVPPVHLTVDYAASDRQSLALDFSRTGRAGPRTYLESSTGEVPPGPVTQAAQHFTSGHDQESDYDGRFTYTQHFQHDGELLKATLHRSTGGNTEQDNTTTQSLLPPGQPSPSFFGFDERKGTSEADLDYTLPLDRISTLKAGYAHEEDTFDYLATGGTLGTNGAIQALLPALNDTFDYRLMLDSLYASYQAQLSHWDGLFGLRAELAHTLARQGLAAPITDQLNREIYPTLRLERHLGEDSTLSLGASRRITRQAPVNLNPFVDPRFAPTLRAGNPQLQPQYADSIEAGYQRETRHLDYSLTAYYRRNSGTFTDLISNLGSGVTLATTTNLPRDIADGAEFTLSTPLSSWLTVTTSGNLFHRQIDTSALGIPGIQTTTGLNGKIKLEVQPTANDKAQILVSRTDRNLTPQGYVDAIDIVNASYRHSYSKRLSFTASVTDLFNGRVFRRYANTLLFDNLYQRAYIGRVVWVSMSYSFGKASNRSSKADDE